jgi:polyferredoxin
MKKAALLKTLRITSQGIFVGVFLFIFLRSLDPFLSTENPFLRFDLLIFLTHLRVNLRFVLPIVALIVLTVVFGRFYCGWVCPMGAVIEFLDFIGKPIRKRNPLRKHLQSLEKKLIEFPPSWVLLGTVAVTLFFTPPVLQYLHPNIWIIRIFSLSTLGLVFLGILVLFSFHSRRFWCTMLCPLGAFYGIIGSRSIFKLSIESCSECGRCDTCPMKAARYREKQILGHQCIRCFDYEAKCPVSGFHYGRIRGENERLPDLSRRRFLKQGSLLVGGLAAGTVLTLLDSRSAVQGHRVLPLAERVQTDLIRPPGVTAVSNEREFIQRCLRCFQCVRSCPNGIIDITGPGHGFDNLFTPSVHFERYGCDYNCQVCQLVCPNYAIPLQTLQEKQKTVMGHAAIKENLCVVFAKDTNCLVCEEVCPVPEKAIKIETKTKIVNGEALELRYPVMDLSLCIGCGICQALCPAEPKAIVVHRSKMNTA